MDKKQAAVIQISPAELKKMQVGNAVTHLLDVRTKEEWKVARLAGSKLFSELSVEELENFHPQDCLVFHCHHGGRSQRAAEEFVKRGFQHVYNLQGGIDAWSLEIDPSIPRY